MGNDFNELRLGRLGQAVAKLPRRHGANKRLPSPQGHATPALRVNCLDLLVLVGAIWSIVWSVTQVDKMESRSQVLMRLLLLALLPLSWALKFDIQAHPGSESAGKERCIRNFVAKDQLVVVTATVSGSRGDGQMLNMHVRKPLGIVVITDIYTQSLTLEHW